MAITLDDLLNIEPSKISRDLSTYITYLYGAAKVGKTTFARDMQSLILECEVGTKALSGAKGQKIKTWAEIKQIARLCQKDQLKQAYKSIAIDTVDIAAQLCEKYICSQNGVSKIGEIPYGQGWTLFKKEFEETFRSITMEGFAVLFISHDKEKTITRQDGTQYNKICATCPNTINEIVKNMSDIIGYAYQDFESHERYLMLRSLDGFVDVGCRFKYIEPKIKFGYDELVEALNVAIDKEEEVGGVGCVTNERITDNSKVDLDFDSLLEESNKIVGDLYQADPTKFEQYWQPRVTEITDRYLGKGKKVQQCTRDQAEQLSMIVIELRDLIK